MSDERTPVDNDKTSPAETEKNVETNRANPAETEEQKQQIDYDEFLDDRFQATDN